MVGKVENAGSLAFPHRVLPLLQGDLISWVSGPAEKEKRKTVREKEKYCCHLKAKALFQMPIYGIHVGIFLSCEWFLHWYL